MPRQQPGRRLQHEIPAIPDVRLSGGRRLCSRSSQPDDAPEPQRHPVLCPGDPLMAYLMQVWRGVPHPKFGGHGWVTYGGAVSEARAYELLALSQRLRPELRHKLETISPG